ncbi:MAG: response regulator [Clostridiales bacterium]|nr:response regulator [Clostridiales bacterium]
MELLRLVIVDDEDILLQGLLDTYDWNDMGFEVVGSARSGEQALRVIRETAPQVVLTDIRMKQITGLMVMEEIRKSGQTCLFIVLSAYQDFAYAQQACDLGAFAYLLKPIDSVKLRETMERAYRTCLKQMETEEKSESWEKIFAEDSDTYLRMSVWQYICGSIPKERLEEIFAVFAEQLGGGDLYITIFVDHDLAYKIMNAAAQGFSDFVRRLEEKLGSRFFYWRFDNEENNVVFLVNTKDTVSVRELKQMVDGVKTELQVPIVAAISKPYRGIPGIRRSYEEAKSLFVVANLSADGYFAFPAEAEEKKEGAGLPESEQILRAVRQNDPKGLKQAFVDFIYGLPTGEESQCRQIHYMMVKAEFMVSESYGMSEELRQQFQNYYTQLRQLTALQAVNICYKILVSVVENRKKEAMSNAGFAKDYIHTALAYIDEHLQEEDLSIVSVASYVYLNPVYFGRVFKNTMQMTFKQYLLQRRLEKAKSLLEEGNKSIGAICEQVGISNPSYFSHVFKQYTGKLPREYKREL